MTIIEDEYHDKVDEYMDKYARLIIKYEKGSKYSRMLHGYVNNHKESYCYDFYQFIDNICGLMKLIWIIRG